MLNGTSSSGTPYNYNYKGAGTIINNYYNSAAAPAPEKPISLIIPDNVGNINATGTTGYNGYKIKKPLSLKNILADKVIAPIKKIRMRHIMTLTMFGVICFSRCGSSAASGTSNGGGGASRAYEQGVQQGKKEVLDSIRICNLEKELQLAKDSIKMLKKMPK